MRFPSQNHLLVEGLNVKDILVDVAQVAISSGAIVVSGGAGGDIIADVLIATEQAKETYAYVQKLLGEVKALGEVLANCLSYDLGNGLENYYNVVQESIRDTITNGFVGQHGIDWLDDLRESVELIINKIVRSVSKWVGALIPDDFGLGGPTFEATITSALNTVANGAYDYTLAGLDKLPRDAKRLLIDDIALEDFLREIVSSLSHFIGDLNFKMENPDPEKANLFGLVSSQLKLHGEMTVAPLTGLVNIGMNLAGKEDVFDSVKDDQFAALESLPSWHPTRKLLAWGLPKVESTLEAIENEHCSMAAETLGYLMKILLGAIGVLQSTFDEEFMESLNKIESTDISIFSDDDLDISLTPGELGMTETTRKMRITETKLRQIIRRVLAEGEGDGLNDPQVEEAYYELQSMSPSGFAPDADFAFLDEWPYTEALEILQDEEYERQTRDDPPEEYDDDDVYYASMEASMRARQNRGMYEIKSRLMREFGESDAEVIRQSQNREKMIGIGMDGGTIGFDPNWDYATNRPLRPKKMHRLRPHLQMVADMIRGGGVGDDLELMPGRNGGPPDMFYFTMVGSGIRARVDFQSYSVQKNHPEFTGEGCFISVQGPDAVKDGFAEGAETTDPADIERVLENFKDWASNNIQEDSPWMTFAPAS